MVRSKTSCLHRGNTFFADVEVAGEGTERLVRVSYNGVEHEARTDGFPADVVAHLILRDLVVREVQQVAVFGADASGTTQVARAKAGRDRRLLDL